MRKIFKSLKMAIIPFLTVFVLVTIANVVYVKALEVANGDTTIIVLIMLLTIFMLSLLFSIGDVIRRKIVVEKPVSEILRATEKIASGDFSVRLNITKSYEKYSDFDTIMENVNAMAEALEKSEMLNADFISNVSHEIKTPLSIIRNHALLIKNEKDDEKKEKHVQAIALATERLTALVTNVLTLNKLENQQLIPDETIRIDEMLAESVISFEDVCEQKGITLDCDFDEVTILSKRNLLEIVWNNLLSNAVKFTENGGTITVTLKEKKDKIVVSVADTGCGITKEVGERIFDKFYQGDTSHSGEGNGLGLALVKKVIDVIGGEISVKSEIAKGSTFTVTINKA